MRKILTALVALVSLFGTFPVVTPSPIPEQVAASVVVPEFCDMQLSDSSVSFGTPIPGTLGTEDSVTITMPTGNDPTTPTILGNGWTTVGGINNMLVGATVWGTSSHAGTTLTDAEVATAEVSFGLGNSVTLYMNVNIPEGQAADTYTQTIIITGCQ
jgi:hypothetical protein